MSHEPGAPVARPTRVLVYSGHLTDAPGREVPRFPEPLAPAVERRVAETLDAWGFGAGDLAIGGGARGADTLIAEACVARGVAVRRVLSHPVERFLELSVRGADPSWERRFRALEELVGHELIPFEPPSGGANPHELANLWCLEQARTLASPGQLYGLVVWDELTPGDGPGGTSHFVSELRRSQARIEIINPRRL